MSDKKEIIRVEKLRREFIVGGEKVKALRGVSFTIGEGEFVTIMGTSGSGKSTLLNILGTHRPLRPWAQCPIIPTSKSSGKEDIKGSSFVSAPSLMAPDRK